MNSVVMHLDLSYDCVHKIWPYRIEFFYYNYNEILLYYYERKTLIAIIISLFNDPNFIS